MEYISRPALMGKLTNRDTQKSIEAMTGTDAYNEILMLVNDMDKADVAPVRHERWIEKPYLLGITKYCSACEENYGMPHGAYRFCPSCGARMDGGADHGQD